MDYKKTLNLPVTKFSMKANLVQKEPDLLKKWDKMKLYEKIRADSKEKEPFILHDGPPYANGNIHMGTALNKILKDIIIRSRQMAGYNSIYVPGWDCHGLPIEHNVDKELGRKKKNMTQAEIRKLCRLYAKKYIDIQREEFKRLGVMGEWDNPYLTMNYEYEATIAKECGKFAENKGLVRSKKPILWCSKCQTALAEAEIEYSDETSPSIFVKFPMIDQLDNDVLQLSNDKKVFIVIWTTTPWTIPANLAVSLHPDFVYCAIDAGNNEVFIIAKDLVESCMKTFKIFDFKIIAEIEAQSLEHKKCRHPIYDRNSTIILGSHVTLEAGTGCVHTAPGHGREDYEIGLSYNIDVYSVVNEMGRFTDDVEFFKGMFVFDANNLIIDKLKEMETLVFSESIEHSYPHCWRCKKPVIFRATPQWFISMEKTDLRKKSLEAIDKVKWIPAWGRDRIYGMIEKRPDWCVSRQRAWGVPITVLYCDKCQALINDKFVFDKVFDLFKLHGADVWFEEDADYFLPENHTCSECGNNTFKKETDILDVWFDSGVSHSAVLEKRSYLKWPADLYLEGSDQHRGWFHSSLLTAVGTRGCAPYKAVLTHGFVVDADGKKMSKSVGNIVAPKKIINRYGAEILRLWVSAADYRDDIRISDGIIKQLSDAYRRIRNTCRFMLGNLYDFDPDKDAVAYESMNEIDRFALYNLSRLITKSITAYENYEFHVIYHSLYNFCTIDLSAFYLDILKDRLYTSPPQDIARKSAQTVMHILLDSIVRLMAPILSFTSEEIWKFMPETKNKTPSVHMALLPIIEEKWNDNNIAEKWQQILKVRSEVTKALEEARVKKQIGHPLDAKVTIYVKGDMYDKLFSYADSLKTIFIVSEAVLIKGDKPEGAYQSVEFDNMSILVVPSESGKCSRCWIHDLSVGKSEKHPDICHRCVDALDTIQKSSRQ